MSDHNRNLLEASDLSAPEPRSGHAFEDSPITADTIHLNHYSETVHACLQFRGQARACDGCSVKNHAGGSLCADWCAMLQKFSGMLQSKVPWLGTLHREEILENTFSALFESIASFGGESSFDTWANAILSRKIYDYLQKILGNKPRIELAAVPPSLPVLCRNYPQDLHLHKTRIIGTLHLTTDDPPPAVFSALQALSSRPVWQKTIKRLATDRQAPISKMPRRHPRSDQQPLTPLLDREHFDSICEQFRPYLAFQESRFHILYALNSPLEDNLFTELQGLAANEAWQTAIRDLYHQSMNFQWRPFGQIKQTSPDDSESRESRDAWDGEGREDNSDAADSDDILHGVQFTRLRETHPEAVNLLEILSPQAHEMLSEDKQLELEQSLLQMGHKCLALFRDYAEYGSHAAIVQARARAGRENLDDSTLKKRTATIRKNYERCLDKIWRVRGEKRSKRPRLTATVGEVE